MASAQMITPLIQESSAPSDHRFSSLDDAIEFYAGELTWSQLLQVTILSLAWFFDAQQTFIAIFTDSQHKWTTCLQCSDPMIGALPSTCFFMGSIVGALLLSPLSDSLLGRKKMLVLCCLMMSVTGATSAASVNVWMYSCLRFLSGFGRNMIGGCVMVHSAELVGKKWRAKVGVIGFVFFALGFLSLPLIAFGFRESSWRLVYLSTCVPCIFYCLILHLLVEESPRWLFVMGRKREFAETLLRISRRRASAFASATQDLTESMNWEFVDQEGEQNMSFYSSIRALLHEKWAFARLLIVSFACFNVGVAYYGMPFALQTLSFDLYLSTAVNAVMELPASLMTFIVVGRVDRRVSILGFSVLCGVCSVATAVAVRWKAVQMVLEMVAFTTAVTVLDLVMIYMLELFPTCVRNSAMTAARLAMNLGGAVFQVVTAAGKGSTVVPYCVTGVAIFLCGVLVMWLPETRGRKWSDLMKEEEQGVLLLS